MSLDNSKSFAQAWVVVLVAMLLAFLLPGAAHAQAIHSDCRLANPNSLGQHVSEICWFQFGSANEMLEAGTPGTTQDYDVALPDGSRITYTARVTGGTHADPGLAVLQAPTWTGSHFSGSSGYYTILTPNAAALNTPSNGRGNGVVLTLEDIRLFRPDGSEVDDLPFQMVMADAERLNSNPESMDFGVVSGGQPWEVLEWLGNSANNNVSQSTPPAGSACLSSYVHCTRFTGTSNGDANTVVLASERNPASPDPFTVMAQIHSNAGQGFAIGVRWGSVRLRKSLPDGRIAPQDQFVYRIRNFIGNEVASGTTSGIASSSPWISATAMPGNRMLIEEEMAPGSASLLSQYSRWVKCEVMGGGPVLIDQAYNPANPPQIVIDSGEPGDSIECEITNRPAQFELTVGKTTTQINGQPAAPGTGVAPGDVITYQIEVTNTGSVEAVVPAGAVVEIIPGNTEIIEVGNDFTCYLNSCSNTGALTIAAGASAILDFIVRVDDPLADGVTEIVNHVAVDGVDCASAGNKCSETLPLLPSVTVVKSADPASGSAVAVGAQVTYTLSVTVANVPTTSAVVLRDTLGTGMAFDSVSVPGGFIHDGAGAPLHVFTLPAGAGVGIHSVSYVATVTVDAGDTVGNTVVAEGGGGPDPDCVDCATEHQVHKPSLELTKTASLAADQSTITYVFSVENTGNVALTDVSVSDPLLPALACPVIATLAPGASQTFVCTGNVYTVQPGDVDASQVENTATASGQPPTPPGGPTPDPVTDDDTVTTPIEQTPGLSLVKSVTSTGPYAEDDVITYQFVVTNTGNVTLTDVSVTDELVGLSAISYAWPGADGVLDAGQSVTATATYTVTGDDVNAGNVHNSATADGTPPSTPTNPNPPPTTTPPSPVDTPIEQAPSLSLVKSVTSAGPYTQNDTISYQFVVANTGDVTLTDVSVTDELVGLSAISYAWPGADGVLLVGESVTATATYTVTGDDVNAGNVHNSATANGTPPSTPTNPNPPPTTTPPSPVDTPIEQAPSLSLVKSVTSVGPYAENDTISYQFVVANTGDVTLTGVSVTDELVGLSAISYAWPGADGVLLVGESVTATATYTVTGDDVNAGNVHNSATAEGTPPPTPTNPAPPPTTTPPSPVDTPIEQAPGLELNKSVISTGPYTENDTITYQFVVTNTGDVTLTGVLVTDELVGLSAISYAWPGADGVLLVGESVTATATYAVTGDDVNAGNVHNSAKADGTPPPTPNNPNPPPIESPPDEEDTPIAQEPGLELNKSVISTGPYTENDTITYQFVVTNTGDVTLTDVSVTDPLPGLAAISYVWPGADGVLDAGQSVTATATYTVTGDDVNAGNVHNVAKADGTPPPTPSNPNPPPIESPPDEEDTPIAQDPSLGLVKSVISTGPYTENDTITYQFVVTNTGDVTLTDVSVTDPLPGLSALTYTWPGTDGVLLVGESVTATATYTVTGDDVNAGNVHNSATADGTPPSTPTNPNPPPTTTPPSPVDTPIEQAPSLSLVKSVTSAGPYTQNDTISYQFVVANTGDVTLTDVSVTDELVGLSAISYAWPGADGVLLVGESVTATATYTVTGDDVNAGNVHNSATADGTPPSTPTNPNPPPTTTPPSPVDTPIEQAPSLELDKSVISTGPYTENDTITYQFVVTNTGDVTLADVSVTDPLPGLSALTYAWPGADGVLLVGQSVTATATYTVTGDDVNVGNVHNSATAEGTPPSTPTNPNPPPTTTPPSPVDTPIEQAPSLSLVKSVTSVGPYVENDTISYQFLVANTGDVTLTDVSVTDELVGLSTISYAWPAADGVLLVGESVTATASYVVSRTDVNNGFVHNTATAAGTPPGRPGEPGIPIVSPPDDVIVEIETGTDLSIVKVVDNATPIIGENVVFTLIVRNAGPADATGVVATDALASGYAFVSSAGDGAYDAATGLWTIGDLANGGVATLSITVTVNATGDYRNTASVTGNENDPEPGDNTDEETPTPMPRIVAIDDPMGTVDAGNTTSTVLGNDSLGPDAAQVPAVVLTPGEPSHPGLSMNPDGTITIAVDTPTGTYTYPYTICDAIHPTNCDTAIATIEIVGNPVQLRVVKSVATRTVNIGDLVRYTVTVENIGPVNLVDGYLVDTPPTGFSYVEGSMSVRDADGAFTLAPGHHPLRIGGLDIAAGADATIVYLLRVGAGVRLGTHVNEAVAVDDNGNPISNVATAEVLLDGDPMLDDSLVFGTVFDDRDGDGWQDRADLGGVMASGGFAPGVYVADSTTIDTGSGPVRLADASSPLLHGVDVGAIRARESEADPAPTVVIRQRLNALEFNDGFVLTSKQGVTVRMTADGSIRVERDGEAARGLNAAEPTVERQVSAVEGGYEVAYVISNQGIDERGIPGVRIASAEGLLIETDQYGRYHLADVHGGDWGRGRNFILKVDPATLPAATEFTTANPLVRRVTPGIPARFDFGVKLPVRALPGGREQLDLELGAVLFAPGSAELREAYRPVLDQVAERINAYAGGEVMVTADGDKEALAFARAGAVRDALEPLVSAEARQALEVVLRTRVDDPHSPVVAGATASGALLGTMLFDTDKSVVRPEFNGLLDAVAARLDALGGGVVVVVGHTDVRGSHAYNAALGLRRATAIYEALATRLRPEVREQVRVESSGDPAAPIGTDAR